MADATTTRGYSATKDQLLKRLRRVEGQVRGIEGMVEETATASTCSRRSAPCRPRSTSSRSAFLDQHANHCVMGAPDEDAKAEKTDELMAAVGRLMRRG